MREDRPPSMVRPTRLYRAEGPRPSLFQWPLRYPKGRKKSTSLCPVITGTTGPLCGKNALFYTSRDPPVVLPGQPPGHGRCQASGRRTSSPAQCYCAGLSRTDTDGRLHFASAGTWRILWVKGVAETQDTNQLLIILLPSFQGGRQTELFLGGSLSPSIFARRAEALRATLPTCMRTSPSGGSLTHALGLERA